MQAFHCTLIRNCRRYTKKCYRLNRNIDKALIRRLEKFGILEITNFSVFSSAARDIFKVRFDDEIEISGTLSWVDLSVTVSKRHPDLENLVEEEILDWYLRE